MGYTTNFTGRIKVDPPLNAEEREYLIKFSNTRRMNRTNGPYFIEGSDFMGQGKDSDIIDFNDLPKGQPGLWCKWEPNEKGNAIVWNGMEKFYNSVEWMRYLIDHFIGKNPLAVNHLPFFTGHNCNGTIRAQGEDPDDKWVLIVSDNTVDEVFLTKETLDWIKENKIDLHSIQGQIALKLKCV